MSIVLGYKLFVIGVMGGEKTRINAQAGPIKLTLANAGPGSVFALFGAFIMSSSRRASCSKTVRSGIAAAPDSMGISIIGGLGAGWLRGRRGLLVLPFLVGHVAR